MTSMGGAAAESDPIVDQGVFVGDESTENKVLLQVLALVQDKISEVKNQAVKWLVTKTRVQTRGALIIQQFRAAHQNPQTTPDGDGCRQAD